MASVNKVILIGNLTADPELKQTPNGISVASFSIAVQRRFANRNDAAAQTADFINIVAWRQQAEFICRYFKKGQAMLVCGELQTRSWEDSKGNKRYATEVVASEVTFCEAKRESEGNNTPANQNAAQSGFGAPAYVPSAYSTHFEDIKSDDDLPF